MMTLLVMKADGCDADIGPLNVRREGGSQEVEGDPRSWDRSGKDPSDAYPVMCGD